MSNLVQWEPFRELLSMRRDLDRLFDESLSRPAISGNNWLNPLVDMYQTDDEIVVKATIPGIHPDDVDIQITGDTLTIRAESKEEQETKDATYHLREQRYRSFSRTLTLPAPVLSDKADAEVVNGVLELHLPKAEEAKPKSIQVKAK